MTWSLFWPVWLTRMVVIKLWLPAVCLGGSVTWHDPAWTHRRTQSLVVCSCRCRSPANCGCGGGRIQQRYVWFILMLSCMVHVCIAHAHAWCQRFWRAEESRYRVAFSIGRGNKKGEKTEQACSVVFFYECDRIGSGQWRSSSVLGPLHTISTESKYSLHQVKI